MSHAISGGFFWETFEHLKHLSCSPVPTRPVVGVPHNWQGPSSCRSVLVAVFCTFQCCGAPSPLKDMVPVTEGPAVHLLCWGTEGMVSLQPIPSLAALLPVLSSRVDLEAKKRIFSLLELMLWFLFNTDNNLMALLSHSVTW